MTEKKTQKQRLFRRIRLRSLAIRRFFHTDIWCMKDEEFSPLLRPFVSFIKVITLSVKSFIRDGLFSQAAALTFTTMLSIIPVLAVLVGIAKGFGFQNILHDSLLNILPAQEAQLNRAFAYVENYLGQIKEGIFVGIGLLFLLYTVLTLILSIEETFNGIWQAVHPRSWTRRLIDYLALFILLPIILVALSGLTILMKTLGNSIGDVMIFSPLLKATLNSIPFIAYVVLFVGLYMFLPNVKVRFLPAFIAGLFAGVSFQLFQTIYISGLIWIARYNAVYGSFAAVPLLMLWLQLSWIIVLLGAQLAYYIQHHHNYIFEEASEDISKRYFDFVAILLVSKIVQRFGEEGQEPYSVETISDACGTPLRLTSSLIAKLCQAGVLIEVYNPKDIELSCYQPAIDPSKLTVDFLMSKLDKVGAENFRIDITNKYLAHWEVMNAWRNKGYGSELLLKDIK